MALLGKPEFRNLEDLFVQQLGDLYDAEQRLTEALPKMAEAASNDQLKQAFSDHLRETKTHVTRLEGIFRQLGRDPVRETCHGIKGLIREGEDMIGAHGDDDVRDAGLIAAAQRVEHYEMAGYGTVRAFARRLGHESIAGTLQQTLNEEGAADHKLTAIAESTVNTKAAV